MVLCCWIYFPILIKRLYVDIPLAQNKWSTLISSSWKSQLISTQLHVLRIKLHSAWAIHSEKSNGANLPHFLPSFFTFPKHHVKNELRWRLDFLANSSEIPTTQHVR